METKAALSRIKALSQSVVKSEENANDLVDLLEYLQVAKFSNPKRYRGTFNP